MLDCAQTAALLRSWDKILVMSHASPDGDTLGSASALLRGLVGPGEAMRGETRQGEARWARRSDAGRGKARRRNAKWG